MTAAVAVDEASWRSPKCLWDFPIQAPRHLIQKVCFHLSQHRGSSQAIYPRLCHRALLTLSQCLEVVSGALLSHTKAGSSQHLSLSAQESLHTICNIWSWNCEAGERSGPIGRAYPPHETRPRLTVAELLRGPLALASLPSVTKPAVGGLPESPMGRSATFRQSTYSLTLEWPTATCTCRDHSKSPATDQVKTD